MSNRGIFEEGDEVDFDQINEQNLKNIPRYELVRDANVYKILVIKIDKIRQI